MMKKTLVENIFGADTSRTGGGPLFTSSVPAGFPSPADDYQEGRLDLNEHLVRNPAATFFVRVTGDSMTGAGINPDDLLVVDRSREAKDKNIVIARIDGDLTVKRIRIRGRKVVLMPENEKFQPQTITEGMDFEVWGVVTSVIHRL